MQPSPNIKIMISQVIFAYWIAVSSALDSFLTKREVQFAGWGVRNGFRAPFPNSRGARGPAGCSPSRAGDTKGDQRRKGERRNLRSTGGKRKDTNCFIRVWTAQVQAGCSLQLCIQPRVCTVISWGDIFNSLSYLIETVDEKNREIKLSHLSPIWKCFDEEGKGLA